MSYTSFQNQQNTVKNQIQQQQNTPKEGEEDISFGEELSEMLESNAVVRDDNRKASEINVEFVSEEKEQEYRKILNEVVKNVQCSLGMYFCWSSCMRATKRAYNLYLI